MLTPCRLQSGAKLKTTSTPADGPNPTNIPTLLRCYRRSGRKSTRSWTREV